MKSVVISALAAAVIARKPLREVRVEEFD